MQVEEIPGLIGNRYELRAKLGQGGMGVVYRADDRLTGQEIALKRLLTPLHSAGTVDFTLPLALTNEFRTLAALRHPNIISVLDYGFDHDKQPYFTMDYLQEAAPLHRAGTNQPLQFRLGLIVQILQALVYLHRHGIVHRDLKPENILVTTDGQVHLLDFGLAAARENLNDESLVGTPEYMAPEVIEGQRQSRAADLYAVGVMIYELIAGHHPFVGADIYEVLDNILSREPDMLAVENALRSLVVGTTGTPEMRQTWGFEDTPTLLLAQLRRRERQQAESNDTSAPELGDIPFTHVLRKLLRKTPEQRYNDAQQVIDDLSAALGFSPPEDTYAVRESFLQSAKFVGRAAEFRQLAETLDGLRTGQGSLWLVGGESGVGKSRLLEEVRTVALVHGLLVLFGQAISEGGQPYQLWREPLRRLLIAIDVSDAEASILKPLIPDIDRLLGRSIPNPAVLTGSGGEQRLMNVIRGLFRRYFAKGTGGILVILEDLQWTEESLDVIKALVPLIRSAPLMIIGSYRDDERPELAQRLQSSRVLKLERLSQPAIGELSEAILGSAGRKPQVVDLLERETEGNIFFLVEVLRALAEDAGHLDNIGTMTLPASVFTGGVRKIIQRRVNQIPPGAQPLLKLAAVAGRKLDLQLLEQVDESTDIDQWLMLCANATVLDVLDGHWRFTHDKLREFILTELQGDENALLHRQIAEAIETLYADDLDRYALALALHWHAAGDRRKEAHYTLIAAARSFESNAYMEARRLYETALAIRAYDDADNPVERHAEIHYQLGYTLHNINEYEAARTHHRESLALYRSIEHPKGIADALTGLGEADIRQGLIDQAEAEFQEAQAIRVELNLTRDIGYGYMNLGLVEAERGHWTQADELFQRSVKNMEQEGAPRDLARALNNLANTRDILGDKEAARALHHRALEIREHIQDMHGVCYSLGNLGWLEYDLKNYDQAKSLLERALDFSRQVLDRAAQSSNLLGLGDISFKREQYEQARGYYQQSLELCREIEHRGGVITSISSLGNVERATGSLNRALELYQDALANSTQYSLDGRMWETLIHIAELLQARGELASALALFTFVQTRGSEPEYANQEFQDALLPTLDADTIVSAQARAAAFELDNVVARIMRGDLDF